VSLNVPDFPTFYRPVHTHAHAHKYFVILRRESASKYSGLILSGECRLSRNSLLVPRKRGGGKYVSLCLAPSSVLSVLCNTLQHTATHGNTLQYTATYSKQRRGKTYLGSLHTECALQCASHLRSLHTESVHLNVPHIYGVYTQRVCPYISDI